VLEMGLSFPSQALLETLASDIFRRRRLICAFTVRMATQE
jgi:hypothetical protein